MLAMIAVASAFTFGWAGWEMLRQESAAEEQRERERLENKADRVVQTIERVLSEIDQQLDARHAAPRAVLPATSAGLQLVFDERSIQPVAPSVLVFYPVLSVPPEPPESIFAAAETDEFQHHALAQSGDAYRRLARTPNRAVRAASLVRLARVLRQQNRGDAALEIYRELAGLEGVHIVGAPAALVARDAEMRLLEQLGRHDEADALARALQQDLASGRWPVTSGQYEHYTATAARISGREISHDQQIAAAAHAVLDFWSAWRAAPSPRGRLLAGPQGDRHFVAWRSDSDVSGRLHNTGIAWRPSGGPGAAGRFLDDGHFAASGREDDRGRFKTPTLREVGRTSPYMHDGSKATLEDVVNFYDDGGRQNPNLDFEIRPLGLTVEEKRALVSFLRSLSGRVREGR